MSVHATCWEVCIPDKPGSKHIGIGKDRTLDTCFENCTRRYANALIFNFNRNSRTVLGSKVFESIRQPTAKYAKSTTLHALTYSVVCSRVC